MSEASHPTLCQTIPIYNYLIDIIKDFIDQKTPSEDVVRAANNAKDKLLRYYLTSDGLVYIISTSMYMNLNFILTINNNFCYYNTKLFKQF
jgi:hypothetical protein